ncbi:terminase small subunit [Rhodoferax antarcticus]|nr:terminase small subunit [Rhodoferax antarcticus]APW46664.1 hypothetical protein RA876_10120 [Rhodoferax antarcticus]
MNMHKNQLTARQKLFCEHMVGAGRGSGARAARLAGFSAASSHVTACRLLKQEKIARRVRELQTVAAVEVGYTRERVVNELVGAFNMAKLMENPAAMIASMRQIALIFGYFNQEPPKVVVDLRGEVEMDRLQRLSDSELIALIAVGNEA